MRIVVLLSLLACFTAQPAVAVAQQRAGRAGQPAGRSGIALTVTDAGGGVIPGVIVDVTGPMTRNGLTDAAGQISFPGLPAGTYRLRFSGDAVTAFEREVTLRAGQVSRLDIKLSPAAASGEAPPPPPTPPPPTPAPSVGPRGEPHVVSRIDLVERDLIDSKTPRKDTLVACSGNTRSMLVQLNEPQAKRVYDGAEALYYVIAGEGSINLDGRDLALGAGVYAALPRGAAHTIARKGRRPLILLAVLSGEPCEVAR